LHKTWLKTAKMSIEDFLQCLSLPVPYINRVSSVSSFIFSSDVQSLLSLLWNKKFVLLNVLLNSYCEWTFYFLISSNLCETRFILLSQQWNSYCYQSVRWDNAMISMLLCAVNSLLKKTWGILCLRKQYSFFVSNMSPE